MRTDYLKHIYTFSDLHGVPRHYFYEGHRVNH